MSTMPVHTAAPAKGLTYRRLTPRLRRFVDAYLTGLTASDAVRAAGWKVKNVGTAGWVALQNVDVQLAIRELAEDVSARVGLRREVIVKSALDLATFDIACLFNDDHSLKALHEIPLEARRAIEGIEVSEIWEGTGEDRRQVGELKKVKLVKRLDALELCMKYARMLPSGGEGSTVNVNVSFADLVMAANAKERQTIEGTAVEVASG